MADRKEGPLFSWAKGQFRMPEESFQWHGHKLPPRPSWECDGWWVAHIGTDGDAFEIEGLCIFGANWRDTGESVQLPHPQYPGQIHAYCIYEIQAGARVVRFAACEVSYGAWGFWVPGTQ